MNSFVGGPLLLLVVLAYLVYNVSSVRNDGLPERCVETLIANPNDCTSYYICLHGRPWFKMPCGPGTHWNDRLKVCDWPHNANCKVAKIQATRKPSQKSVCSITGPFFTTTEATTTIFKPSKPSIPESKPPKHANLDLDRELYLGYKDSDLICYCN